MPSRVKTYGYRAFSVCAPNLWNSLPLELRLLEYVEEVKKALKTELFKRAYFNLRAVKLITVFYNTKMEICIYISRYIFMYNLL